MGRAMSALGHKQTFAVQKGMSALSLKADIHERRCDVCFVPIADSSQQTASLFEHLVRAPD